MDYASKKQVEDLDRKVDEIITALKGNDMGTSGVIPRLARCESKISLIKNNNLKSNSIAATIASTLATSFTLLITYLKSL